MFGSRRGISQTPFLIVTIILFLGACVMAYMQSQTANRKEKTMFDPHGIISNALEKNADWKLRQTRSGGWVLVRNYHPSADRSSEDQARRSANAAASRAS